MLTWERLTRREVLSAIQEYEPTWPRAVLL
jgi:hypothetical protein